MAGAEHSVEGGRSEKGKVISTFRCSGLMFSIAVQIS